MSLTIMIESCAAWPDGIHVAGYVTDKFGVAWPESMASVAGMSRDPRLRNHIPVKLCAAVAHGRMVKIPDGNEVAERIGRGLYLRQWLDLVRACYPTVKWRDGSMRDHRIDDKPVRCAVGFVGRKMIAAVAEVRP